jgi:hypothetical protein
MCLAMSVTYAFAYYQHLRELRTRLARLGAPYPLEDVAYILTACDIATYEELQHVEALTRPPVDFAAILEWARAVLWEHEEWPVPS